MKLLILFLLSLPSLVLSQSYSNPFPPCKFDCPGSLCTPWPAPLAVTTTTIMPSSPTSAPTTPGTITKIWSTTHSDCQYVYWLDVSDFWSLTYTTVTTFGPVVTGPYPAIITETVISTLTYSYVEIWTGGSSWTESDMYTLSSTVVVTATQPSVADAVPTGDVDY